METEYKRALMPLCGDIEILMPEFNKLPLTLLKIHFVLNLIHEQGTVILPRNWRNWRSDTGGGLSVIFLLGFETPF